MNTTASPFELHALEKLREEELQEARAIQSVMLPAKSLRAGAVMISHEFRPVGTWRGVHKTGTSPHDVLATLNLRLMIRGMPRRYAAIQDAVFNAHSPELQIASAGMPGPFHLSASGCRSLKLCGIPPAYSPRRTTRR